MLDLLLAGGVQRRLQLDIERSRPGAAPVHRAQHLDVAHRIEAKPAGNALADQGQDALHRLFGVFRRHEVEVALALPRVGIVKLTLRPAQCRDAHSPAPLPSASLSARHHQPCRLALPQILPELPGC